MIDIDSTLEGVKGFFGPNDYGYMHNAISSAAKSIKSAQSLYSQGYGHSNAKVIPMDSNLRKVMYLLSLLDKEYCFYANKEPDPELFSTYEPPYEDTIRWSEKNN